jgi:hypothetical protein
MITSRKYKDTSIDKNEDGRRYVKFENLAKKISFPREQYPWKIKIY